MKVRVVLVTENEEPASGLGENPEEIIKVGWALYCKMMNESMSDTIRLESAELME